MTQSADQQTTKTSPQTQAGSPSAQTGTEPGWKAKLKNNLRGLGYDAQQAQLKLSDDDHPPGGDQDHDHAHDHDQVHPVRPPSPGQQAQNVKQPMPPPAPAAAPPRKLYKGRKGKDVNEVQTAVNLWGSDATLAGKTALAVDGKYGDKTKAAVTEFQKKTGAKVDGIVGPETRRKLKARKDRIAGAKMTARDTRTMAQALVVVAGTAGNADKAVVVTELLKMPQAALEVLRDEGAKVWVCKNSVTEIRADLRGVRPRGWPVGKTWDNVPGLFDPGNNRTIIATRGGVVPATGDGHGSHNLVIHEVGHAVDHNSAASNSPAFVASRDADKAGLSAYEKQAGTAGKEETYAESMGRYYGGDATDKANNPNLNEYWKNNPIEAQIFAEVREAAKSGGTAAYVKTKIKKRHLSRANATERAGMITNLLDAAPDTGKILEILKAGNANATLTAIVKAGKLPQFFAAHRGAALTTLYTVNAVEIQKHKTAHGGR